MQETGKLRARRIDRGYYHAIDPFVRNKRIFGLGGLVVGSLYSLWAFTGLASPHISSGDLSNAHFAWNENGCENCHLSNVPIRPDAWGGREPHNVLANNNQCNTSGCHQVTAHHADRSQPNMFLSGDSCAECHREHLGKDLKLVELHDRTCTRCHENIQAKSVVDNSPKPIANVMSFSKQSAHPHPDFRSLDNYVGTIKFSHAQHLSSGQALSPNAPIVKRFENIDATYRQQYAGEQPFTDSRLNEAIQLQCADCHEPDGIAITEPNAATATAYGNGELKSSIDSNMKKEFLYYSPVRFDKHCIACHDLDNVPHGLDRKQTEAAVAKITPVRNLEILRKLKTPGVPPVDRVIDTTLAVDIEARLSALMTDTGTCSKCHTLAPANSADNQSSDIVSKSSIRDRWFKSAIFSHGAHMMVACKECHKEPYEKSTSVSVDATPVTEAGIKPRKAMIEGIDGCRNCHISDSAERAKKFNNGQPLNAGDNLTTIIATADCVDCHRFHVDEPKLNASKPIASKFLGSELVRDFLKQGTRL